MTEILIETPGALQTSRQVVGQKSETIVKSFS